MLYADIGQTKEWGYPIDESHRDLFPSYSKAVWFLSTPFQPDVVLIDGRFRVACFFATMANTKADVLILFDDYVERSEYHYVEEYAGKPLEIIDRMAVFLLNPGMLSGQDIASISKYYYDPR